MGIVPMNLSTGGTPVLPRNTLYKQSLTRLKATKYDVHVKEKASGNVPLRAYWAA